MPEKKSSAGWECPLTPKKGHRHQHGGALRREVSVGGNKGALVLRRRKKKVHATKGTSYHVTENEEVTLASITRTKKRKRESRAAVRLWRKKGGLKKWGASKRHRGLCLSGREPGGGNEKRSLPGSARNKRLRPRAVVPGHLLPRKKGRAGTPQKTGPDHRSRRITLLLRGGGGLRGQRAL